MKGMTDYCLTCGGEVAFDEAKGVFYCVTNRCKSGDTPVLCPYCQYKCDMEPGLGFSLPLGLRTMILCNQCGEWSRFTDTLGLEKIVDINEIEPDTFNEMARLSTALKMSKAAVKNKFVLVEVKAEELQDFFDWLRKI